MERLGEGKYRKTNRQKKIGESFLVTDYFRGKFGGKFFIINLEFQPKIFMNGATETSLVNLFYYCHDFTLKSANFSKNVRIR